MDSIPNCSPAALQAHGCFPLSDQTTVWFAVGVHFEVLGGSEKGVYGLVEDGKSTDLLCTLDSELDGQE